jgi:HSP20 family protein
MLLTNRWNPLDEIATLHRDVDRIFGRQWSEHRQTDRTWAPPAEVTLQQDVCKVRIALPGIDPNDVRIDLHGNTLRIAGDRPAPTPGSSDSFHTEFAYGPFERTFELPTAIDRDKVNASYRFGLLELTLPVAESEKPRRIEITGGHVRDIDVRKLA